MSSTPSRRAAANGPITGAGRSASGPFVPSRAWCVNSRRIVEREPVRAIFCRYSFTQALDAPRFAPAMIDLDDLPTGRLRLGLLGRSLKGYRTVFVTKESDVAKVPHPDVRVLPCISTSAQPTEEGDAGMNLLFLGSSGHPPNAQGVARFVSVIWPRILAQLPEATLTIAGTGWERYASARGVRVPGFVASLNDAYRNAAGVVCPIWSGAGACVKLAEAVGFARPVVASAFAAEGYAGILVPGEGTTGRARR